MASPDREPQRDAGRAGLARRVGHALVVLVLWRLAGLRRGRRLLQQPDEDPSRREAGARRWAERLVLALMGLVALAAAGFVVLFVLDPNTQLLGLALGIALALAATAMIVASRWLVVQETAVEDRPRRGDEREVERVARLGREGLEGITRRRLLAGALGVAGAGATAAVAIPVVALGPGIEEQLRRTPWHSGRALVDDRGEPILADAVTEGSFLTAFPHGADKEDLDAPVVVVRVDPATLRLPSERSSWAPQGIIAFSKICTHAACAISLYRSPLSPTTQARGPALVCPCHYSTFDVLDGGSVEFGPAGRPLPQLPLSVDPTGALRAAGPMSGPVGPAWFGDAS
jgi:ubiquinol-cytochrome c reductase iron-sulfur subunit